MRSFAPSLLILLSLAACRQPAELPVFAQIEDLRLETSLGDELTAGDLDGKVLVVDFIFTSCTAACPVMAVKMKQTMSSRASMESASSR